ncbi:Calcium/calmodulin dependent protein kinase II Association [Novipirellula aureliae]|uniref:Calcium/calmodulin dependent protein kinase II Association n=1 Tax=Novipirellula aureliae TaxID=2527966 RepID=A0A5C6DQU7_9BACT|nr:nuclear transport factor 2 family protein [Novipirellula aureliae]TWU39012.1 Calcium/calmodulin dependent protein kinase II Association [Novipirellula aureliae]
MIDVLLTHNVSCDNTMNQGTCASHRQMAWLRNLTVGLLMLVSSLFAPAMAWSQTEEGNMTDEAAVRELIDRYAKSIDTADIDLATKVWQTSDDVSFIQPRGHQHGWDEIRINFYEKTMGANFSKRSLKIRDLVVHVIGNAAWVEFYWTFDATMRKDLSTIRTQGRETQVLKKTVHGWRIVHVHYSGMPVTGDRQGF